MERIHLYHDKDATEHFITTLQHKKSCLQELLGIDEEDFFPEGSEETMSSSINNILTRNRQLNRVELLLVPPPSSPPPPPSSSTSQQQQQQQHVQQQQQQHRNVATMMLKTWHKAITKLATVPNNAGASAIFTLFQARPVLLEKRLKRPASAADATDSSRKQQDIDGNRGGGGGCTAITSTLELDTRTIDGTHKRRRL